MALLIPNQVECVAREYEVEFGALGLLHQHPELPVLLEEMAPALRENFLGARLGLELAVDREGSANYLVVWVHTSLELDEADAQLTAFDPRLVAPKPAPRRGPRHG